MAIWLGTKDDLVRLKAERGKAVTEQAWEFLRKEALPDDPRSARYPFNRPK